MISKVIKFVAILLLLLQIPGCISQLPELVNPTYYDGSYYNGRILTKVATLDTLLKYCACLGNKRKEEYSNYALELWWWDVSTGFIGLAAQSGSLILTNNGDSDGAKKTSFYSGVFVALSLGLKTLTGAEKVGVDKLNDYNKYDKQLDVAKEKFNNLKTRLHVGTDLDAEAELDNLISQLQLICKKCE